MVGFKYCEVKFFKEQAASALDKQSKIVDQEEEKNISRQVKISFFLYEWSEDQFEDKCIAMLELFQKRHKDFEITNGCLDFSKEDEVSLFFIITCRQKMIKSQIRSLKQELTFLVQSISERGNPFEKADLSAAKRDSEVWDSLETLKKKYEELKTINEKSYLLFEQVRMNDDDAKILIKKLSEKTDRQIAKLDVGMNSLLELEKMNKIEINSQRSEVTQNKYWEEQQQLFNENNHKVMVKFDYLLQTVERLESRVINDQKKIMILQETHQKMFATLDSVEAKMTDYLVASLGPEIALEESSKKIEKQTLSEEASTIKRAIDELKENLISGEQALTGDLFNKEPILSVEKLGFQSSINDREIQISEQQQIALENKINPLAKEHKACKKLFSNSNAERNKNKKIKVSKEEFLLIINRLTFCEFNWSYIATRFSKELFNLYDLPVYQGRMEQFSAFLESLNPDDFTIPFIRKKTLFINSRDWNQLQGYKLLNQYLEHILKEHGLLMS